MCRLCGVRAVRGDAFPKAGQGACTALSKSSVAVAPDGYIYKCKGEIGGHKNSQGHIRSLLNTTKSVATAFAILSETGEAQTTMPRSIRFRSKYLPLCMSGCPKQQMERYRFNYRTRVTLTTSSAMGTNA